MERAITRLIRQDLDRKMVFLSGPRQVGKTTLAKSFVHEWPDLYYLNFDAAADRQVFLRRQWDRTAPLVVFDEIHKWSKWKGLLKGVFDTEGIPPRILVTGSGRLDLYRKGGDSLAGRYFSYRLLPLSVKELEGQAAPAEAVDSLMRLGSFPEPLLSGSETFSRRWRKAYIERIVREDVRDLTRIRDLAAVELLVELLRERVGSPISFSALAGDLHVAPNTVRAWIEALERLYLFFRVTPYHHNVARALLKEPKIYFYDPGLVRSDNPGPRLENVVAVCLLKSLLYAQDVEGRDTRLHYLRDKEKREVDFVTVVEGKVDRLIEVKWSETDPGRGIRYYAARFPGVPSSQIVGTLDRARTTPHVRVEPAGQWLASLPA